MGTLGANAPFIGLFGTVLGIIKAFHELAQATGHSAAAVTGGAPQVMSGISEALVATAVLMAERPTADAIFAHANRNLAPYQRIRRIEFENVPKSISGKIRRIDLRVRENPCEADGLTREYRHR